MFENFQKTGWLRINTFRELLVLDPKSKDMYHCHPYQLLWGPAHAPLYIRTTLLWKPLWLQPKVGLYIKVRLYPWLTSPSGPIRYSILITHRFYTNFYYLITKYNGTSLSAEICRSPRNEIRSTHPRTDCHHYNPFIFFSHWWILHSLDFNLIYSHHICSGMGATN